MAKFDIFTRISFEHEHTPVDGPSASNFEIWSKSSTPGLSEVSVAAGWSAHKTLSS
jgi:hypothetical protein